LQNRIHFISGLPPDLLARDRKDAFWEDLKQLPPTVKLV
jgi:hypothetical protein